MKLSEEIRTGYLNHVCDELPTDDWADRVAELEAELAKYTGAEANEYGQSQQRIARLEKQVRERRERMKVLLKCIVEGMYYGGIENWFDDEGNAL